MATPSRSEVEALIARVKLGDLLAVALAKQSGRTLDLCTRDEIALVLARKVRTALLLALAQQEFDDADR